MTRAAYARYKGVDRAHITRLAQAGRLVLTSDRKLVRVVESDRLLENTRDPSKEGVRERFADKRGEVLAGELALQDSRQTPAAASGTEGLDAPSPGASEPDSLMDVRRDLITEQAARARLQRLELEGRLIDRETVRRAVFEKARVARNALFGLADRLSTPLAAEANPAKVYDLLVTELRRICNELAAGEAEPTRQ